MVIVLPWQGLSSRVALRLSHRLLELQPINQEQAMANRDQRSNKMVKKPKKDTSPPKETTSDRPMPPTTTVLPKGKLKNK